MSEVRALLFDLGGVVIEIDFDRVLKQWEGISVLTFDELKAKFHFDAAYEQHERGEIDAIAYFAYLRDLLQLDGSNEEIAAGWNSIFVSDLPEVLTTITRAREYFPTYAFTNTNPTHLTAWQAGFPAIFHGFDKVFISYELGLRKPERAAFDAIAADIDVAHEHILFFDDTHENIVGAKAAGLQTVHVQSPTAIDETLTYLLD